MLQLKNLRKERGITQTKLSEYMGITQATLSGWENEKFEIDTESLKKLAKYFNVSVDYLLGLEEANSASVNKKMNNLKQLRKEKRLTQQEMANMLNISQNAYSYWENDKVKIDNKSLEKLSSFFGVSIDYILGLEEAKPSQSVDQQLNEEDFAFFGEVQELTSDEKEDVLNFINFIKSKRKQENEH